MAITIPEAARAEYGDAFDTLKYIQETVETIYAQAEVDLPDRRFVAAGDVASSIANDCEQVTVNLAQIYLGAPGEPAAVPPHCNLVMFGDFVVQVTRCVPGPTTTRAGASVRPPKVSAIEEQTLVQAVDMQLLLEAAYSMTNIQGVVASVTLSGVQGNMQSVILSLSISLSRG